MKKVVLLDVDGVILRHPKIMARVSQRCVQYVGMKLDLNMDDAYYRNKVMYNMFGHTLLGFENHNNLQEEFTKFVYSPPIIDELRRYKTDPDILAAKYDLQEFECRCRNNGVPIYLFSNAPKVWCGEVLKLLDSSIPESKILHCGHGLYKGYLKPQPELYKAVERALPASKYVFIDDSYSNLQPVCKKDNWDAFMFSGESRLVDLEI